MKLIQILLPTRDNKGRRIGGRRLEATARELTERFGGLTAHTRAPVEGLWKPARRRAQHDDLVIFEVMAPRLDRRWWRTFRSRLERDYRQEKIQTRVLDFTEI
jgi:hypothetical protein